MKNQNINTQKEEPEVSSLDDRDVDIKIKRNKRILNFISATSIVIAILVNVYILLNSGNVLFHDNMSFNNFNVNKKTPFYITDKNKVKFSLSCELKEGYIKVMICDEYNNTIISYDEANYSETYHIELDAGTYYYILYAEDANGKCEFKGKIKN